MHHCLVALKSWKISHQFFLFGFYFIVSIIYLFFQMSSVCGVPHYHFSPSRGLAVAHAVRQQKML